MVATKNTFIESNNISTGELLNKLQVLREDLKTEIEQEILEVELRDEAIYIRVDSEDSSRPAVQIYDLTSSFCLQI